jgi:hypothetical protein
MTAAAWPSEPHPLYGVRLGKMERFLLSRAPTSDAMFGYVIDDADRSIREQLRRAAVKLERVGLVERLSLGVHVRARDVRREGLRFSKGRFWRYVDPTRAHAVRRNVVWKSPFGLEIYLLYRAQLEAGSPIRWDERSVRNAKSRAAYKSMDRRWQFRHVIEAHEQSAREAILFPDPAAELQEVEPAEIKTREDRGRWKLAIAAARQRASDSDAAALWDLALRLYETEDRDSLAAESAGRPRATKAEQFRRQPRRLRGW